MHLRFNERKATEAAARLLELRGGRMSYLKLIKLLYLVDREALLRWGRPVTTDRYVSMDRGPVVSRIYELIREEPSPDAEAFWRQHISTENWDVVLIRRPAAGELSNAEGSLIAEIFGKYGGMSRWELVELAHALPEWIDPEGGAFPIEYRDILNAGRKTQAEIAVIEEELRNLATVESLSRPL
jgi:uncharacterized phage-associated protein